MPPEPVDPDDPRAITTERLTLRPHAITDHPDCAAMWGDPAVVRFIGTGVPLTDEEAWSRLLRYAGCWRLFGYGYWAVRERVGDRFVGDVGFQKLRRAATPALPDRPEIGWVLAASAHGRGYAREAVGAALVWADRHMTAPETFCIIRAEHRRSIGIAEAAGYSRVGTALLRDRPLDVLTRSRSRGSAETAATP